MKETITILMTRNDADMVEKIFSQRDNPRFTIVSRFEIQPNDGDSVYMELCFESGVTLWYLAKEVEMTNQYELRIKENIDNIKAKIAAK